MGPEEGRGARIGCKRRIKSFHNAGAGFDNVSGSI